MIEDNYNFSNTLIPLSVASSIEGGIVYTLVPHPYRWEQYRDTEMAHLCVLPVTLADSTCPSHIEE